MGAEPDRVATVTRIDKPIVDPKVALHRVIVDPAWVQDGVVSPQAFLPRPQDHGRLSVSDKGIDQERAVSLWRQRFQRSKANACATVTVELCLSQRLTAIDDSAPDEHHVSLDFNAVDDNDAVAFVLADRCLLWSDRR